MLTTTHATRWDTVESVSEDSERAAEIMRSRQRIDRPKEELLDPVNLKD